MDYDEIYDNDDFFNKPTEDEYVRDEVIDEAKEEIVTFFNQKKKDVLLFIILPLLSFPA